MAPNARWRFRAEKLGVTQYFWLSRDGGNECSDKKLRACVIEPFDADKQKGGGTSDNPLRACNCMRDTVVVLAHPINKKAKYFFTDSGRASVYLNCGATVIIFDFNGFGESDSIDLFYWKDAKRVVDFASEKYPEKKCILHGASFGAFHVIRASQAVPPGGTLVLENVNKSLISYWKRWPITYFLACALEFLRVPAVKDMNVKSFVRSLQRNDLTVKFLACENDTFTTVQEMQELFNVLEVPQKTFTLFEGASHLTANVKNKLLYERVLKKEGCQLC